MHATNEAITGAASKKRGDARMNGAVSLRRSSDSRRYFAVESAGGSLSQRSRSAAVVLVVEVHPVSTMLPRKSSSRAFMVSGG
jgi:hypothetical protein